VHTPPDVVRSPADPQSRSLSPRPPPRRDDRHRGRPVVRGGRDRGAWRRVLLWWGQDHCPRRVCAGSARGASSCLASGAWLGSSGTMVVSSAHLFSDHSPGHSCSGLRTGSLGRAHTGVCGPAIGANRRPRGPTLRANEPPLLCEGRAHTPAGHHALRTGSSLAHQLLARLCLPSLGSLQGKRSLCPVGYPRTSALKSVGMSPRPCGMTF
jgi:hypothetical protein